MAENKSYFPERPPYAWLDPLVETQFASAIRERQAREVEEMRAILAGSRSRHPSQAPVPQVSQEQVTATLGMIRGVIDSFEAPQVTAASLDIGITFPAVGETAVAVESPMPIGARLRRLVDSVPLPASVRRVAARLRPAA